MKTWLKTCWTVARWEFFRYFKLKDQLIGLVSLLIGAVIGLGAVRMASSASRVEVGVIGQSETFHFPEKGKVKKSLDLHDEKHWRELIQAGSVDGLLKITALPNEPWKAELIVRKEPAWLPEIQSAIQAEKMLWEMQSAHVEPRILGKILEPTLVRVEALERHSASRGDRLVAYCMLGATLMTSWIGLAYMMTGITGEKQQRVTEQIVSAIRPQLWIDGKLIGITAASIGSLAFLSITGLLSLPVAWCFGNSLPIPSALQRWELVPAYFFFYFAGVFFWNCFYAAVSAVINDPNTSSRSSLLFLPMLPMIASAVVASQPDGWMMKTLSLLPGTSVTAMPMRLILGIVTWGEMMMSMVLLLIGIVVLRTVAGRIFAAGIMLYGKEPSWTDIAKWAISPPSVVSSMPFARSVVLGLGILVLGNTFARSQETETQKPKIDTALQVASFDMVWQTIKNVHWDKERVGARWDTLREELRPQVEKAESMEAVRAILESMLAQLGQSHCGIIPRESYEIVDQQSKMGGEGISGLTLRLVDDQLLVTQIQPDSPASEAGIEIGWVLQSVTRWNQAKGEGDSAPKVIRANDLMSSIKKGIEKQVTRLDTAAGLTATSLATGSIGEKIELSFLNNQDVEQKRNLTLVQGKGVPTKLGHLPLIHVEFQSKRLADDIGYIAFNAFFDPSRIMKEFQQAIHEDYSESRGLIIDLRGNMGGMVLLTMGMSGWFVEEPKKLGVMQMKGASLDVAINPRTPKYTRPIAVLIDECSISAAEIYASGLQDNGIARVFGKRSAGLVLPSNVTKLPNNDGFQYVMADYASESGRILEGYGVEPNEPISITRAGLQSEKDPVLAAAKRWILERSK